MTFIIGQRWVSQTESRLGLGVITEVSGRQITISFPAVGEERTYASNSAPLSRMRYHEGEIITTLDDLSLTVSSVEEQDGLLFYRAVTEQGEEKVIDELDLNCFVQLVTPQQRLLNGQIDKNTAFRLRVETLYNMAQLQQSPVRGLIGARTDHIPHQVYIAHEVAQRFAPRVLLADEVGLGKTIEAGLIIHHQLQSGRARRVLIVVPDSLIHQWLVEMLRRFNLPFSVFDQSRYDAILGEPDEDGQLPERMENPFETEQRILCTLSFLKNNTQALEDAESAEWDLLVVDEAHHLHWSAEEVSHEYQCVERLAAKSRGLLLLTATPEQVGIESHFARLRLLDPARFYDLEKFKAEESGYARLNDLVKALETHEVLELDDTWVAQLRDYLGESFTAKAGDSLQVAPLVKSLLDRHGTGRILFRNTRSGITGFPGRHLNTYALPLPEIYSTQNLYPETRVEEALWIQQDPRVAWLYEKLKALRPEKVLVICAHADTALALEDYFRLKAGIRSAVFYEGLTLVERDRAAAYFADEIDGAQVLICSEIGSEGRNFQFAHHLVMFDLPMNPDLLEQRIGRLDRIGQTQTIEIHVPYLQDSPQERLLRWYNEGAGLFEKSCSAGFAIYEQFADRLNSAIEGTLDNTSFDALLQDTAEFTAKTWKVLNEGRDRLLERNSCHLDVASKLITQIEAAEEPESLTQYMSTVFDQYGVEHDGHSEGAMVIQPGDHMREGYFPGLKDEAMTITFDRKKALSREDMVFLSWEHPMVTESMEMILDSEFGNVAVAQISLKGLKPGMMMLEAFYTLNTQAPKDLQLDRFLPLTPIRVLVEANGKNLSAVLDHDRLNGLCQAIKRKTAQAVLTQIRSEIEGLTQLAQTQSEAQVEEKIQQATAQMKTSLNTEIERLVALQKVNPSIRDEEITFLQKQAAASETYLKQASLRLEALRLVINAG
jgi:ATP-dependent helicase HepA